MCRGYRSLKTQVGYRIGHSWKKIRLTIDFKVICIGKEIFMTLNPIIDSKIESFKEEYSLKGGSDNIRKICELSNPASEISRFCVKSDAF